MTSEITAQDLSTDTFIKEKVAEIRSAVGEGTAINALSGGVDSSTVTLLGHRALGDQIGRAHV
jgi:GMP synthase (glutamine-hydrolysing)